MRKFLHIFTNLLVPLVLLSGCLVDSQKANQIFESGQFPKVLQNLASPIPDSSTLHKAKQEGSKETTLLVGVIDSGVDYLHPRLKDKMAYQFSPEGDFLGVGKDILGEDNFPHPNLINGELFAFGAKGITEKNKIVDPLEDPIKTVNEMNQRFMELLTSNIRSEAKLNGTLFQKNCDEKSFSIFSIYHLVRHMIDDSIYKTYTGHYVSTLKGVKFLFSEGNTPQFRELYLDQFRDETKVEKELIEKVGHKVTEIAADYGHPGFIRNIVNKKWRLDDNDSIYPCFGPGSSNKTIHFVEGFDDFVEVAKKTIEEFEEEKSFLAMLKPLSDFRANNDNTLISVSDKIREENTLRNFGKTWNKSNNPTNKKYNSIKKVNDSFCFSLSDEDFVKLSENSPLNPHIKSKIAMEMGTKFIKNFETLNSRFATDSKIRERRKQSKINKERFDRITPLLNEMINEFGPKLFYCSTQNETHKRFFSPQDYSNLKKEAKNTENPYLGSKSQKNSHGTHVSGIISTQHNDLRIFPIRVITDTPVYEREKSIENFEWFKENFLQFIKNHKTALLAIRDDFVDIPKNLTNLGPKDDLTPLYTYIESEFNRLIDFDYYLDHLTLDVYFIRELTLAMKEVGANKLKVVNVSLGTEKLIELTNALSLDKDTNRKEVFSFFEYEFFKNYIAKVAKDNASQSLFVIAAGNSKIWLDGKSHSALPCDLSSRKLSDAEKKYSIKDNNLPQNNMTNILCVGSINSKSDLSSFTNIPLTDIPFVVTEGEYILSPVKTTDCSIESELFTKRYGEKLEKLNLYSTEGDRELTDFVLAMLKEYNPSVFEEYHRLKDKDKRHKLLTKYLEQYYTLPFKQQSRLISQHLANNCAKRGKDKLNYLSGTSMATPFVTGHIGKWLISEAKSRGIKPSDLYHHPDYTPEKIIQKIMNKSPVYECAKLKGVCQIKDISKIDYPKSRVFFIKQI